jgi:hypothetical protein
VLNMHLPPEDIPLPDELEPCTFTTADLVATQIQPPRVLLPPVFISWNNEERLDYWTFDSKDHPIWGACKLRMLHHEWPHLTDDKEGSWRGGYVAWPRPTSVKVPYYGGSKFVGDYHGIHNDFDPDEAGIFDWYEDHSNLSIERKEGVRWSDVLDEATGTMVGDEEFWARHWCAQSGH